MEIESFKIKFVHIAGKDNILADTLSRLIDIDPDVELQSELKDYKFDHYAFETLPKAKGKMVHEVITSSGLVSTYVKLISHMTILKIHLIQLNFHCLTKNFLVYRTRIWKLDNSSRKSSRDSMHNSISLRKVFYTGPWLTTSHKFEAAVVPEDLIHAVLHLGHNQSSHNGYQRTYAAIKCVYYWKGMRKTRTGSLQKLCHVC